MKLVAGYVPFIFVYGHQRVIYDYLGYSQKMAF